ncbi:calnexin independence factor cif1 [Gigaspora margarita]|uniref:Calnexin independence factor cif1 n=1 Tax=Gigaspora margarita TaxID=4874 RepID=A0A8H4AP02_GIGMA|nr:calnexin independence factor cif1 [Gigaspora margarita]
MQASIEKHKNENEISNLINMSQEKPVKKFSRHAHYNKKCKLEKEQNSALLTDYNVSRLILLLITSDIIFNSDQHRTQHGTQGLCTRDKIYYIEKEWKSVSLCPLDHISLGSVKICEEISAKDLLVDMLIQEARSANNIELSDIPSNFLLLVNKEIIKMGEHDYANSNSDNAKNKRLWVALGRWLGMEEPVIRRDVHRHLRSKWIDLKYAIDFQNNESQDILRTTSYISRKEKARLIISARGNLSSFKKLVKLHHLTISECVTDVEGRTLVHLALLNNPRAKKRQITIPPSSKDCRRDHISLVRARHGLRAEDLFPDL